MVGNPLALTSWVQSLLNTHFICLGALFLFLYLRRIAKIYFNCCFEEAGIFNRFFLLYIKNTKYTIMEMTKISKEEKIIRDIHRQLFKETMPIANYDELIKDEKTNFKSYIISMWTYHTIVEEALKDKKLTPLKKAVIRNQLNSSETLPDIKRL